MYVYICGWVTTASRLYRAATRRQFTFSQKFLVLIRSIWKGWKAEMTLNPSSGFELVYCELFLSEFSVLSGRLIKNMFPLHVCRLNDYATEIIVYFKFNFTIFLLMFFPLFSNFFTSILKNYEVPKIYNKILKKLFTIIIYQVNSMSQFHLASELYWKCTLEGRRLFWH